MQVALAHVHVDQQYALPGLGNHGGEVGGDEGLAHRGAGAGDHQAVVFCFQCGEVQAGAQAAQGFDGQVGRVADGKQRRGLGGAALALAAFIFLGLLQHAVGDRGVDRQAQLLDGFRILDAAVECLAYQHQGDGDEQAEHGGDQHDQRFLRLNWLGHVDVGGVNDPHVTYGAGAHHVQFLRLVQQLGVDLRANLYITGQAQQFLLGFWQTLDFLR
ncbi:hypothetical protein D3C78_812330 [compost metagenome]